MICIYPNKFKEYIKRINIYIYITYIYIFLYVRYVVILIISSHLPTQISTTPSPASSPTWLPTGVAGVFVPPREDEGINNISCNHVFYPEAGVFFVGSFEKHHEFSSM